MRVYGIWVVTPFCPHLFSEDRAQLLARVSKKMRLPLPPAPKGHRLSWRDRPPALLVVISLVSQKLCSKQEGLSVSFPAEAPSGRTAEAPAASVVSPPTACAVRLPLWKAGVGDQSLGHCLSLLAKAAGQSEREPWKETKKSSHGV